MAQTASLFADIVNSFFPKLQTLVEKINGRRETPSYLHLQRLRKEYSADQKWESATVNTAYVAADMVALDSPLPLKERPTLSAANGTLPKIGMKKFLNETQLNSLNIMRAQGASYEDLVKRLMDDVTAVSRGVDEKNEYNFLAGLSNGVVAIADDAGENSALRIRFNYPEGNSFGVETAGLLTLADLRRVMDKAAADGNSVAEIWIAKSEYDRLRATREARELVATYNGQTFTSDASLPVPTATRFNEAFADDTGGVAFVVVNRSVFVERNGRRSAVKPWNPSKVIMTMGGELGALVWGTLAEATSPVDGVAYQTLDQYKLISKYSKTDPLQEFTAAQALVLPVIENVDQIYSIDISEGESVDASAETSDTSDKTTTIDGVAYDKASAVAFLNGAGASLADGASDAEVVAAYNALSKSDRRAFASAVTKG